MEYLKVWTDFREIMEPLTDVEKGRLFDAMLIYAANGEEPGLSGNERFLWAVARQSIDRTRLESERLRANGAKGGRPRKQDEPVETKEKQPKPARSRFITPTVDEVRAYCKERGNNVSPERFVAFYESKGWRVGDQPMKSWKAAIITWEQRDAGNAGKPAKVVTAQQYDQRKYENHDDDVINALMAR